MEHDDETRIMEALARLEERLAAVFSRLDALAGSVIHRHEHDMLRARVDDLEAWRRARDDTMRWAFRMVVGAVATGILAGVVALVLSTIGLIR